MGIVVFDRHRAARTSIFGPCGPRVGVRVRGRGRLFDGQSA